MVSIKILQQKDMLHYVTQTFARSSIIEPKVQQRFWFKWSAKNRWSKSFSEQQLEIIKNVEQ